MIEHQQDKHVRARKRRKRYLLLRVEELRDLIYSWVGWKPHRGTIRHQIKLGRLTWKKRRNGRNGYTKRVKFCTEMFFNDDEWPGYVLLKRLGKKRELSWNDAEDFVFWLTRRAAHVPPNVKMGPISLPGDYINDRKLVLTMPTREFYKMTVRMEHSTPLISGENDLTTLFAWAAKLKYGTIARWSPDVKADLPIFIW